MARILDKKTGRKRQEFPPPIIDAFGEPNQRILRRIAVAMLERAEDELDVVVGDANEPTFSYCPGALAFTPVSERAQEYLEGYEGERWLDDLVLEHPKAGVFVEELERRGFKLGVRLGYKPNRSERWVQRIRDGLADESGWAGCVGFLAFCIFLTVFLVRSVADGPAILYTIAAGIVAGYLARTLVRRLRRAVESRIEKQDTARRESWKRTLRADRA